MTPQHDIRAVIFDVDGVLVDSYDAHFKSWVALAQRTDVEFTETHFAKSFGRTSADILDLFWPPPLTPDRIRELDDIKEALFREIVEHDFPAMPGATECITALRAAGKRIALGSSGPPENVQLAARKLAITDLLGAMITGFDVTKGKPDPEVFLTAAERLETAPEHCAVVEDAPAGILAARAAGMLAIGYPSKGRTPRDLLDEGAAEITTHLLDIPYLIQF